MKKPFQLELLKLQCRTHAYKYSTRSRSKVQRVIPTQISASIMEVNAVFLACVLQLSAPDSSMRGHKHALTVHCPRNSIVSGHFHVERLLIKCPLFIQLGRVFGHVQLFVAHYNISQCFIVVYAMQLCHFIG